MEAALGERLKYLVKVEDLKLCKKILEASVAFSLAWHRDKSSLFAQNTKIDIYSNKSDLFITLLKWIRTVIHSTDIAFVSITLPLRR